MPSDEHVISFRRIYLAIGQVAANLYFISIDMSQCNNTSTVHPSITSECTVHSLQIVYVLALAGILLVAIGLVLIRKCSSVMSRIISKRRRQRFVRNTASRSSRSSSHGTSYLVRTQDQQTMQLPIYQNTFEYVDMLAETPTTNRTMSEDNLTARLDQEQNASTDPLLVLYDEPDSAIAHERERSISTHHPSPNTVSQDRTRSISVHQLTRTSSVPEQKHSTVQVQRGVRTRESTRSMPGVALNSAQQRQRAQTTSNFQRSAQHRRSMFDTLPDVPTAEPNPILDISTSVESVHSNEVAILGSNVSYENTNNQLTVISQTDNRISRLASEKQFSYEDGSLLGSNVPPFCDPELSEGRELEAPKISIYSSQILDTEEHAANSEVAVSNTTDTQLYDRLDHSHLTPPSLQERSQPEGAVVYSQLNVEGVDTPPSLESSSQLEEETEALYDTPIVIVSKAVSSDPEVHLRDIADPTHIFDDPGYTEGMMAAKLAQKQSNGTHSYQSITTGGNITGESVVDIDSSSPMMITNRLALQVESQPALMLSANSLSLLDYGEEELNNLDPDIASCLMTQDEQISFV